MKKVGEQPVIFFFIADHVVYDDATIYLGEGLKAMGIPFYSNRNYWREDPATNDYLFNYNPGIDWKSCDIVVMSSLWFVYTEPKTYKIYSKEPPIDLFDKNRKYKTVYLDVQDGYRTNSWDDYFRNFDFILRGKYNKLTYNPSNLRPWLHGFTNRTIYATADAPPVETRRKVVLQNYNYSHNYMHGLRALSIKEILPLFNGTYPVDNTITPKPTSTLEPFHQLMWEQTEEKHHPGYYKMIGDSLANACFCGDLIPALPFNPEIYLKGGKKAQLIKTGYQVLSTLSGKKDRIIQWDSWRFWETLSAGAVAIHIDLEKYGVDLPVMPVNWKHYVGIDLDNIKRDVERFCSNETNLFEIAREGKAWVFKNYSPKASAERFMKMVAEYGN